MTSTQRIRDLNDRFRTSLIGGLVVATIDIRENGEAFMSAVIEAVQRFDAFTEDNDPYGEHDFGSLTVEGRKVFWKIDYYDGAMERGSDDPSNPDITTRVLTLMLAHEW